MLMLLSSSFGLRRIALVTLLFLTVAFVSITRCLPLAGWSAQGYTVDASRSSEGALVVGHCFRLHLDADVRSCLIHIQLRGGEALDVRGSVHVITPGSTAAGRVKLPKGSQILVEKVLRWRNVETSSLTPYIRIDSDLIDASELFRYGNGSRLTFTPYLLEPCDANGRTKDGL